MGAPAKLANTAPRPIVVWAICRRRPRCSRTSPLKKTSGEHRVFKEPIGVCGLITPWNWPVNQIGCKVAPALAVGCTMVLKPSEVAPLSAYLWTQVMHEAGVPGRRLQHG